MGAYIPPMIDVKACLNWIWFSQAMAMINKPLLTQIWSNIWWKYCPGEIVEVSWPRGWHPLDETGEVDCETSDPNTAYRWYLEKYVGKQGWDWDWKLGSFDNDSLLIKVRKNKATICSLLVLKWKK